MGQRDVARVDVASVLGVARQYDTVAGLIDDAVRTHLTGMAFDGASAGRTHVGRGDALCHAVGRTAQQLRQWSRAAAEIAAELRASADRYVDADALSARRMG